MPSPIKINGHDFDVQDFEFILPEICDQNTAFEPTGWSENNMMYGHCAIVTLQAQKLFGGKLMRASLENTLYAKKRSHYKNLFDDGEIKDFTAPQFNDTSIDNKKLLDSLVFEERLRSYALSEKFEETLKKYTTLTLRFASVVLENKNPLFEDEIYKNCISQAVLSPCQKAGFGAVITYKGEIVSKARNDTIEGLEYMCDPKCIRLGIQSRTESMLGSCGHAEEWAMKKTSDQNIPLKECDIYIAGIDRQGLPWIKEEIMHSCLRCATQMNYAELQNIYVPVKDRWEKMSTKEALKTASQYALKEKKV